MAKYIFQKNNKTFGNNFSNVNSPISLSKAKDAIRFNYTVGNLEGRDWRDLLFFKVNDHSTNALKITSRVDRTEFTNRAFTLSFKAELLDCTNYKLGYVEVIDPRGTDSHVISFVNSTPAVTSVSLNKTSASINVGASDTLIATVNPTNANNTSVTWTSSNPSIATVDANGVVMGVAAGSATITATSIGTKTDGTHVSTTCAVTVATPVTTPASDDDDEDEE